jgi:ABC-2 type transport system ATP-binding protein
VNHVVEFLDVTRAFGARDRRVLLGPWSFEVPSGVIAGLVGPNGSGKTTVLRIAATLISPTSGIARVLGADCARRASRARAAVGLSLGGTRSFYWRLTAARNLSFFAVLRGVAPARAGSIVRALAEELGFAGALGAPARGLSRGYLGRMAVARALLGSPAVVLLDEPLAALDADGRNLVWRALRRRADDGSSILMTTHAAGATGRCDLVFTLGT